MSKIKMVCSICESEAVYDMPQLKWNVSSQKWEDVPHRHRAYCNDCTHMVELKEIPMVEDIRPEKTLDQKIDDVCFQIKCGLDMSPEGDFNFRIKRLIEELPKSDVIIVLDEKNINVYANAPGQLGTILTYNNDLFDNRYMFNIPKVVELSGDAELWQRTWKESPIATSVVKFLENFITKNT